MLHNIYMFFKRNKEDINNYYNSKDIVNGLIYKYGKLVFLVKNGNGYKLTSDRTIASWKLEINELQHRTDHPPINIVGTIGFRDGTLIQNAKDGRIYMISDAKKRLLTAPLSDYGWDYSMIIEASDDEVQFHTDGEDI